MSADEWVSASEAARIMGVSRQRVGAMVNEGDLDAVRPWPRAVRIRMSDVAQWMDGHRPLPIHRTACRTYVLEHAGVETFDAVDVDTATRLTSQFIAERRPLWLSERAETYVFQMLPRLLARS
jgi:excisionase family DNA binding protein